MEAISLTVTSSTSAGTLERIVQDANVNTKDCYQCGKCSAGCPVAPLADMTPREVIRNLQLGLTKPVLESNMPWFCIGCGMCLARCPQCVDLPSLMTACKKEAKAQGYTPIKEVDKFNTLFIEGIYDKGVSDEAQLAMKYNLTSGHFLQDALDAPKMLTRGMINAKGHEVENADEVRALIDRVRTIEGTPTSSPTTSSTSDAGPSEAAQTNTPKQPSLFGLFSPFKKGGTK